VGKGLGGTERGKKRGEQRTAANERGDGEKKNEGDHGV